MWRVTLVTKSFEYIQIDYAVNDFIILRQGHHQAKTSSIFSRAFSKPYQPVQLSQKFQTCHLFSCKIVQNAKNAFKGIMQLILNQFIDASFSMHQKHI